ncbi:MAG: hypothetical protein ABJA34_03720 [Pseudonocardiales bacterium]
MPEVTGSTTGRVAAGLALVAGLCSVLTGSASATPGPAQTQQVRPEQVTDVARQGRPAPPARPWMQRPSRLVPHRQYARLGRMRR